uniref:HAT C-terminal dimerisation domain-containing protein n=1 Tax=Kryptolebias marmoratus TaxID=37003 RepID=A0A3Q3AHZ6_KRYMA
MSIKQCLLFLLVATYWKPLIHTSSQAASCTFMCCLKQHPWPHIQAMFTLQSSEKNSYIMRCQLCLPKRVDISYKNSTSNLRKRVTRIHLNTLKKYTELADSNKKKSVKITDSLISPRRVTQAKLDRLIVNFVCEASQPFSLVEAPSFKNIIESFHPQCTLITRKTLCCKIQETAKNLKSIIIKKLSAMNHVATTTDCWTARQRSYLGVTCHWIEPTTLERQSAALACQRVKGSHTFDVLAAALEEIHSEYQIREKVTRTTTDSGSNFLKAFRLYGVDEKEDKDGCLLDDDTGLEYQLLKHQKCACHLLNLISTVDATRAEVGHETYRRLSRSAFAKCTALWNKTSRSSKGFETVERECKLQFLQPNPTRWNSVFLAVERVVRIHKEQGESAFRNVCTTLQIKMASSCLHQLRDKLKKLVSSCKVCAPLIDALQDGIQKRFAEIMKEPELIAALERYLSCGDTTTGGMDLLHSFPQIKRLSLKVNTSLPASAACERLFSHAGLLFTAKRSQLHCKNLESQLLLKLNGHITE